MTKEEMVAGLKNRVVDLNLESYVEIYGNARIGPKSDQYWIDVVNLFKGLTEEQKRILFTIVRQIQIDTLAEVLAFLDGIYWVEGQKERLKLVCLDNPEEELNEDLTDTFLNMIYTWNR